MRHFAKKTNQANAIMSSPRSELVAGLTIACVFSNPSTTNRDVAGLRGTTVPNTACMGVGGREREGGGGGKEGDGGRERGRDRERESEKESERGRKRAAIYPRDSPPPRQKK